MSEVVQNINDPNLFLNANAVGDFNDKTSDASGYGELPGVEQNQTYFAYVNGVGNTGPELINHTGYFIKYLIDLNGNISKPSPGSTSLINLKSNFELGKTVVVESKGATSLGSSLLGEHTITEIGTIVPLVITEIGKLRTDFTSSINFFQYGAPVLIGDVPDYTFQSKIGTATTLTFTSYTPVPFTITSSDPGNRFDLTLNEYTFDSNTTDYGTEVQFEFNAWISGINGTNGYNDNYIYFKIQKYSGSVWTDLPIQLSSYPTSLDSPLMVGKPGIIINNEYKRQFSYHDVYGNPYTVFTCHKISTFLDNFYNGDKIRVVYKIEDSSPYATEARTPIGQSSTTFKSTSTYSEESEVIPPYWDGATYPTDNTPQYITASLSLSSKLSNGYQQVTPSASLEMNFSPIIYPANIQPGDNIRFEYDPLKQTKIYNISIIDDSSGRLAIEVYPPIPTGSILDHFVIWRALDDGNYITLNVEKPPGVQIQGWLKPKYMSKELNDNFTNIINKLESDGLLT